MFPYIWQENGLLQRVDSIASKCQQKSIKRDGIAGICGDIVTLDIEVENINIQEK